MKLKIQKIALIMIVGILGFSGAFGEEEFPVEGISVINSNPEYAFKIFLNGTISFIVPPRYSGIPASRTQSVPNGKLKTFGIAFYKIKEGQPNLPQKEVKNLENLKKEEIITQIRHTIEELRGPANVYVEDKGSTLRIDLS